MHCAFAANLTLATRTLLVCNKVDAYRLYMWNLCICMTDVELQLWRYSAVWPAPIEAQIRPANGKKLGAEALSHTRHRHMHVLCWGLATQWIYGCAAVCNCSVAMHSVLKRQQIFVLFAGRSVPSGPTAVKRQSYGSGRMYMLNDDIPRSYLITWRIKLLYTLAWKLFHLA